jgi:hypothetical protein
VPEFERLKFEWDLEFIADAKWCSEFENTMAATCQDWEVRVATPSLANIIPEEKGLYMFVWRPELCLKRADETTKKSHFPTVFYVGKAGGPDNANTLRGRYRTEYANYIKGIDFAAATSERERKLGQYLRLSAMEYWFTIVDDPDVINRMETYLRKVFSPPLNIQPAKLFPRTSTKAWQQLGGDNVE